MSATVYLADPRAGHKENLFTKLERLLERAGLDHIVDRDELAAIKIHFGEKGGHAFIRPVFIRRIVERIKQLGGKPFLTDSCTLYPGERKEAVSALCCGIENGFAYAVAGAPLIMCDGLRGHSSRRVPVAGEMFETVDIGLEILEADVLIAVSHFKCHELTGFGGALKNLGMGCSSRQGKLEQHSTVAPEVDEQTCTGCGVCLRACAHQAILVGGKARIDSQRCAGCGRCITVCETKSIKIQWNEEAALVMKKMAEYAKGALSGKAGKTLFVNFVTQVSPSCDCYGHSDAPIVPDLGILVSTDPVALDQACADLVNQARGLPDTALSSGFEPGGDKFRGIHPEIDWTITLDHAEKIGIGTRRYTLIRLEPKGTGW
ncbi:MAG: 4Fe-4S ferredoxin [Desulfuromonadaceae bacterium GWC2_58_13]|nr:MAG: 4Fe-4S ferredoxin [Desulfuromonadaceae bacterium GWC2_58_13]